MTEKFVMIMECSPLPKNGYRDRIYHIVGEDGDAACGLGRDQNRWHNGVWRKSGYGPRTLEQCYLQVSHYTEDRLRDQRRVEACPDCFGVLAQDPEVLHD